MNRVSHRRLARGGPTVVVSGHGACSLIAREAPRGHERLHGPGARHLRPLRLSCPPANGTSPRRTRPPGRPPRHPFTWCPILPPCCVAVRWKPWPACGLRSARTSSTECASLRLTSTTTPTNSPGLGRVAHHPSRGHHPRPEGTSTSRYLLRRHV